MISVTEKKEIILDVEQWELLKKILVHVKKFRVEDNDGPGSYPGPYAYQAKRLIEELGMDE